MPTHFETFRAYDKLDDSWHEYRKIATVMAKQMDEDFEVATLEGLMQGHAGDYLCEGAVGERWPIKKEVFERTYVKVGDTDGGSKEEVG